MKTLYVSDLDGTLLRSNERTSDFTNETINRLVEQGMRFSYATARSYITAQKATQGLNASIPLIVYNGAFVIQNKTEEILLSNYFGEDIHEVIDDLLANGIQPIVYAYIDSVEKFSFVKEQCNQATLDFLATRKGDRRTNVIDDAASLHAGNIFYVTCIDREERLKPLYDKYREMYHCVYQRDIYSGEQWFEMMPKAASKANAIAQLKAYLDCDRVVVFGDGKNDIDMFEMADECYGVANAVEELKEIATGIIGSNEEDGVAKWLQKEYEERKETDGSKIK